MSSLLFFSCTKETEGIDGTYDCTTLPWFSNTTERSTTTTLKGYILFSWKNNKNSWNYSIVPNLNITPANELVGPGNIFTGEECLKNNLSFFAEGEAVYWFGTGNLETAEGTNVTLSYPLNNTVSDIKEFCDQIKIVLVLEN